MQRARGRMPYTAKVPPGAAYAEPVSDHRQECNRNKPVHYPMNDDVPDLLTGLQDALNVAHDNGPLRSYQFQQGRFADRAC